MIYARSSRPTLLMAVVSLLLGLLLGAASLWALFSLPHDVGALILAMLATLALAFAVREFLRLKRWPPARLALFRDRMVIIQGRAEALAPWAGIEMVSLADQSEWGSLRWPEIQLTDRLTIRLRRAGPLSFRPNAFGLEPIACRDLILELRDDPFRRLQLPEFDSELDLRR